ncbi:MAG: hypothetical protein AAF939_11895 [Planctomycetota bacterium]
MTKVDSIEKVDQTGAIRHQRLRAPTEHGQAFLSRPREELSWLIRTNRELRRVFDFQFSGSTNQGSHICSLARHELVSKALRYTRRYLDVDFNLDGLDNIPVILSGHQPTLFHPGVWFKNFLLSDLASHCGGVGLNLVVDNDICVSTGINFPKSLAPGRATMGNIPLDRPSANLPYEECPINDWEFLREFPARFRDSDADSSSDNLVEPLWRELAIVRKRMGNIRDTLLGTLLAGARHRLESFYGLKTLELPISWMAETDSFAQFSALILANLPRFREIYNRRLLEYRSIHRIRSRSHPVPELASRDDGWLEAPFWIWHHDRPTRGRLFCRTVGNQLEISDLADIHYRFDPDHAAESWVEIHRNGIRIRPRALMTTLFARLLVSDLFIHGIGGAKYDQLTDAIAEDFFELQLPSYLTATATFKLPFDREVFSRRDLVRRKQQTREFRFHPENFIDTDTGQAFELVQQKREWTRGKFKEERSKRKHDAIDQINAKLQKLAPVSEADLREKEAQVAGRLRASEVLGSREYSIALHPETIVEDLKQMASTE